MIEFNRSVSRVITRVIVLARFERNGNVSDGFLLSSFYSSSVVEVVIVFIIGIIIVVILGVLVIVVVVIAP